ncbi:MAG: AAA family ATPase [Spirochaetaceae bacterium]|jgi:MoxR-like ATPase|nr:AAA family ATPase [Spirochaetaceae bacterium]
MPVKPKITALLAELHTGIYEKETVMALALLASVAGESVFLLGPPGVAKSLIARRLKFAYKNSRAFEYLMSHFSTPDEIFGPVSIAKLKDEDKYERITDRYLPGASVVFLDEIWKAGPSIQNALLTALNEKVYRNGEQEIQMPLRTLIAASNELPQKGQGLEALWDRFLLRIQVKGVENIETFKTMIACPGNSRNAFEDPVSEENKIADEEYQQWNSAVDRIALPDHILSLIASIKTRYLENSSAPEKTGEEKENIYISDRRWRKIARLLRTSAFLNDRKAVDVMDCFLIAHCIWHTREDIYPTAEFVRDAIQKYGYTGDFDIAGFREETEKLRREIAGATQSVQDTRGTALKLYNQTYCKAHKHYLKQQDFYGLNGENKPVNLYIRQTLSAGYLYKQGGSGFNMTVNGAPMDLQTLFAFDRKAEARKSGKEFSVVIDGAEYELETVSIGAKQKIIKKPPQNLTAAWNKRITQLSEYLHEQKQYIEKYQKQDSKYLRNNLFVAPECAAAVESSLAEARKEIDKLEVEIKAIQHRYLHLQDEEIP